MSKTKELYPDIAADLRELAREFKSKMAHASETDRRYAVGDLAREALKSAVDIACIAKGMIAPKTGLTEIYERNERAKIEILLLMEMGTLPSGDVLRMETKLAEVNKKIEHELKKLKK